MEKLPKIFIDFQENLSRIRTVLLPFLPCANLTVCPTFELEHQKTDTLMLLEVIDTGLLAWAMPLAASVLLFGIYSVVKAETNLYRNTQAPRRFLKMP